MEGEINKFSGRVTKCTRKTADCDRVLEMKTSYVI